MENNTETPSSTGQPIASTEEQEKQQGERSELQTRIVTDCVWFSVPQPTEWQGTGNHIDTAFVAALAHFVSLDARKQPDVPQKE